MIVIAFFVWLLSGSKGSPRRTDDVSGISRWREPRIDVTMTTKRLDPEHEDTGPRPTYSTIEDWKGDLRTIWQGDPRTIEFTYGTRDGDKTRRKVDVEQVLVDGRGEIYMRAFCHLRNEPRTFRFDRIRTKILDRSQRFEPYEWLGEKLNIEGY